MIKKRIIYLLFLYFQSFCSLATQSPLQNSYSPLPMVIFPICKTINNIFFKTNIANDQQDKLSTLPTETRNIIFQHLCIASRSQLMQTCATFQKNYSSLLLFSLNNTDYTKALVHFARVKDAQTIQFLVENETQENKQSREEVFSFFSKNKTKDILNETIPAT